jgi:hypothetical protein
MWQSPEVKKKKKKSEVVSDGTKEGSGRPGGVRVGTGL